jgi:ATP-dependent RNA helicase RhlE
MLDMGFIHDVRRVIDELPRERQTLLFSATMPGEIQELARRILRDPVQVVVDPIASTVEPVEQSVYLVDARSKPALLLELLQDRSIDRALIFTRTKRGANRLAEKLQAARIDADAIHGNKSQNARERALDRFKRGLTRVIVATDLASRGIDVKELSHVICFELPEEPEVYVHRVGRTGRAGASGTAIALCSPDELSQLAAIERLTRRRLARLPLPAHIASRAAAPARSATPRREPRDSRGGTASARRAPQAQPASRSRRRSRGGARRRTTTTRS